MILYRYMYLCTVLPRVAVGICRVHTVMLCHIASTTPHRDTPSLRFFLFPPVTNVPDPIVSTRERSTKKTNQPQQSFFYLYLDNLLMIAVQKLMVESSVTHLLPPVQMFLTRASASGPHNFRATVVVGSISN